MASHLSKALLVLLLGSSGLYAQETYEDQVEAGVAFEQLTELGEFDAALGAAQAQLALAVEQHGENAAEIIQPSLDLGQAHLALDQYAEAGLAFEKAAMLASIHRGLFSQAMLDAYAGMGQAEQGQGRHEQAVLAFKRAQHVAHRQQGVYGAAQVELLQHMADSYLALGQPEEAEAAALLVLRIHEESQSFSGLDRSSALTWLGHWYGRQGDYSSAMRLISQAIEGVEQRWGPDDERLIPMLRARADIHRLGLSAQARYSLPSPSVSVQGGLRDYRRVAELADMHPEDSERRIRAHLDLADWYLMINEPERAHAQYADAWSLVQAESSRSDYWERRLSVPRPIAPEPLLRGRASLGANAESQYQFAVGADGRLRKIRELERVKDRAVGLAILRMLRMARFRPRVVNGEVVATEEVGFAGLQLNQT